MNTVGSTKLAAERVEVCGLEFWFDGNGKVTAGNGTFADPRPNAFSVLQVRDCPGATPTCSACCYVHRLEVEAPDHHRLYATNSRNLRAILAEVDQTRYGPRLPRRLDELARGFAAWVREHAPGGFRWHVSGDLIDRGHALLVRKVAHQTPRVQHWIYTRSFRLVTALYGVTNLAINLSADRDNYAEARSLHGTHHFRLTYLTTDGRVPADLPEGSVIFPAHELRTDDPRTSPFWSSLSGAQRRMVCPPDLWGQSEKLRCGPCRRCLDRSRVEPSTASSPGCSGGNDGN